MPRRLSDVDRICEAFASIIDAWIERVGTPEPVEALADKLESLPEGVSFHLEGVVDDAEGGSMKINTGLRESCGAMLKFDSKLAVLTFAQAA